MGLNANVLAKTNWFFSVRFSAACYQRADFFFVLMCGNNENLCCARILCVVTTAFIYINTFSDHRNIILIAYFLNYPVLVSYDVYIPYIVVE